MLIDPSYFNWLCPLFVLSMLLLKVLIDYHEADNNAIEPDERED